MTSPYKIALIVLYFGPLPPYFPVWLESAKANPDVDFLFYTDQNVQIDAPNFRVTRLSFDDLRKRFERVLNRSFVIPNGYKLCDYRPAVKSMNGSLSTSTGTRSVRFRNVCPNPAKPS